MLSTPGVVVDGKAVHSGSVPSRALIEGCFRDEAARRRGCGRTRSTPATPKRRARRA
ncbi:MAG: thioredoxin family protein [Myxococcota bacterium]